MKHSPVPVVSLFSEHLMHTQNFPRQVLMPSLVFLSSFARCSQGVAKVLASLSKLKVLAWTCQRLAWSCYGATIELL